MTTPTFQANGLATLIGSLPVASHQEGLKLVLDHIPDVPLWPQLPGSQAEGMLNQFAQGMPGFVEEPERTYFTTQGADFEASQLAYFEQYLAALEDPTLLNDSPFAVSRERAGGLYALRETVAGRHMAAVKGQMTGPFTLLTGLHDQEGRAAYFDPAIRELAVKGLAMKAAWQTRFLGELGVPVIVFVDEPALAGLGSSAFITVSLDEIGQDLDEVMAGIQGHGGLAGVHVCANTDWEFLLGTSLDIVSFDAYSFFDKLAACRDTVHRFLDRGGIIAWGLIPTGSREAIEQESAESLLAKWEAQADQLIGPGRDRASLLRQTLITPSCGTGSLSLPHAMKVLSLTRDLSQLLREKYL
ncbi:MAG: hypothetical protein ACOY3Z_04545 [Thermodesulfobacteriota bacterium]